MLTNARPKTHTPSQSGVWGVQERLPEGLPTFISLQALFIHSESVAALPSALGRLTRLRMLDCTGCTSLLCLPDSLGDLASLTALRLDACLQLTQLPGNLRQLSSLQQLTLGACAALQVCLHSTPLPTWTCHQSHLWRRPQQDRSIGCSHLLSQEAGNALEAC